jgi:hypothetical protein
MVDEDVTKTVVQIESQRILFILISFLVADFENHKAKTVSPDVLFRLWQCLEGLP